MYFMKEVIFDPAGGAIVAMAKFTQSDLMTANYEIMLRQKDSNATTTLKTGDNTNPEDDSAALPMPSVTNDGRRVVLEVGFVGHDSDHYPNYDIVLEIHQDDKLLGYVRESGTLTGKGQYTLLFIKLIAQ